jgi:hypothetical protein
MVLIIPELRSTFLEKIRRKLRAVRGGLGRNTLLGTKRREIDEGNDDVCGPEDWWQAV